MAPAWTIVEYAGRDGLVRLETDWRHLVAEMPAAGYQHLYETHVAYFDTLRSPHGAFDCLALSDGARVRAICPVEPQRIRLFRAFNSSVWGLPTGLGDMPRDLICPPDPEAEGALLRYVARYLRGKGRGWFVFNRVLEGSGALRCLRGLNAGYYHVDRDSSAHVIDCDMPFAEYRSRLTKKFRANLRLAHNRLAKLPDVSHVHSVHTGGVSTALDRLLKVEASGWKGDNGLRTAIALQPTQAAFYPAWASLLGQAGRCEFNELRSADTCLASTFCVRGGDEYDIIKIGYDERFAQVAPGQLVFERIIERCCDDPTIKRINLISGYSWNRVWEPEIVGCYDIYLAVGGLGARMRMALLRMRFQYWPVVKRVMQRVTTGMRRIRGAAKR